MHTADTALQELRAQGFKTTLVRKRLLKHLFSIGVPVSAAELLEVLGEQGKPVNKTTVYRELKVLCEQGVLQELDLGEGLKRYEPAAHHHHLQCSSCRSVECVETDELEAALHVWEERVARERGFAVREHAVTFAGLCRSCQNIKQ